MILEFLQLSQLLILLYFIGINLFYIFLFLLSFWAILNYLHHMKYRNLWEITKAKTTPPISILIPAYNEEKNIVGTVMSILQINYPEYEIIVINDGSQDGTLKRLVETFGMRRTERVYHRIVPTHPVRGIYATRFPAFRNVIVVDKDNGGKADALNAGINVSRYPLFCSVDADSLLEKEALLRVVLPFMERFQETAAVGGIVRIANGCRISHGIVQEVGLSPRRLPRFQVVEYLRAFLSGRMGWSSLKALLIISGAFGIFKKLPVWEVGGYLRNTVGEDMELVVRLHRHLRKKGGAYRISFVPDPVCWTEAPEKLKMLWRQRDRWQRGLGQTLYRHLGMLFNPRYGLIGLLAKPYFLFVEFLSPLVELAGYLLFGVAVLLGAVFWESLLAFFILAVLMGILLSLYAVLLEELTLHRYPRVRDLLKLMGSSILENLGYRQFVSLARLCGILTFLRKQNVWGFLERTGLEKTV